MNSILILSSSARGKGVEHDAPAVLDQDPAGPLDMEDDLVRTARLKHHPFGFLIPQSLDRPEAELDIEGAVARPVPRSEFGEARSLSTFRPHRMY